MTNVSGDDGKLIKGSECLALVHLTGMLPLCFGASP